jgi:lysophospholipase L1-like esterase
VRLSVDLITARFPERSIRYVNAGISGNTVEDLWNRWHDDVLVHAPDWLSVKIGINDLHRTLGGDPKGALAPENYERLYRQCLTRTREALPGCRLVLVDPFYISEDRRPDTGRGRVLALLPEYLAVVEGLAAEFGPRHVCTHAAFVEQLRFRPSERFCPEPVHPNASGHLVIAHALLRELGW